MHDFARAKFAGIVRLWDAVMLASADRPVPGAVLDRGTVLRAPASAEAIEAAAYRVGVELPRSYSAFLAISDGAYANGCGLVTRPGEYGLLPVGVIGRLVDVAADHVGLVGGDVRRGRAGGPGGPGRRPGRPQLRPVRRGRPDHTDGRRRL
jgi:hypothetical protein